MIPGVAQFVPGLGDLFTGDVQLGIETIGALVKYLPFTFDVIRVIIELFREAQSLTGKLGP